MKILFFTIAIASVVLTMPYVFADSWYVGKGLKQGDYFSYNVCWNEWHNCSPIQMNFWIKNETSDGSGWNLEFEVVDVTTIQKGIMTIGKITPDPVSFDKNISDYTSLYRSTISWLDYFATRDSPKTFDVPSWGRTAAVGRLSPDPIIQQNVTVEAGTFNAWMVGWHRGNVDNKIWIDPSLPFPVKAIVYLGNTTGSFTLDYTFELLKTGNNQNEPQILQAVVGPDIPTTPTNMSKVLSTVPEFGFSNTTNPMSPSILSPLKQFKSGISIENVKCINGLQVIGKRIDGSPACVSFSTFAKLISREWGYDPIHVWTVNGLNDKYTTKDVIQFTVMFKGRDDSCHDVINVVVKGTNDKTIWQSDSSLYLCRVINPVIYLEKERAFSFGINVTGMYSVTIFDPSNPIILQKNITITS